MTEWSAIFAFGVCLRFSRLMKLPWLCASRVIVLSRPKLGFPTFRLSYKPGLGRIFTSVSSRLSPNDLKVYKTQAVKTFCIKENVILRLTFHPGSVLTGFRTTRSWWVDSRGAGANVSRGKTHDKCKL